MADYNANGHSSGTSQRGSCTFTDYSAAIRRPVRYVLNRGTNSGAGDAFVYWLSPNIVDTTGVYYKLSVPWVQISAVTQVGIEPVPLVW